jgi:hypothetical protein
VFDWVVVGELMRTAAALDTGLADDDGLLAGLRALVEVRALVDATEAHLLAELDRRGVTDRELGLSTPMWWARQAGIGVSAARARVQVARRLRDRLDVVDTALVEGRISWDHARVIDQAANPRVADQVVALQAELIGLADGAGFDGWRREVRGVVSLLDQDGAHDPAGDHARNHLAVVATVDGVTHVAGTLTGDGAEIARQAIDVVADELFRVHASDHERTADIELPGRGTLRALAFVELCRRGLATDLQATAAPRPDVSLVVRADEPDRAVTLDGVTLPGGSTRTLLCDPDLTAVIIDRLGVPLDLGHKTRLATPAQRRALALRDGGCVFPGCDRPVGWCDAHHVVPHRLAGRTDLANLALLCRHHHGVTHRTGWSMHACPDGAFTWTTPSGDRLHSQRHHRAPADRPP